MSVLVAVTDHAAERFRQRVAGTLDAKTEIASRVARAWAAGRTAEREGERGTIDVRDLTDRSLVFVCRPSGPGEVVVITLWERQDGVAPARVPRRYTSALKADDHRVQDKRRD